MARIERKHVYIALAALAAIGIGWIGVANWPNSQSADRILVPTLQFDSGGELEFIPDPAQSLGGGGIQTEEGKCIYIKDLVRKTFFSAIRELQGENWDLTSRERVVIEGEYAGRRELVVYEGLNASPVVHPDDMIFYPGTNCPERDTIN